ncbi:MAG: hypothetical protein IT281_03535 [Ignavibacteria bacterium]|nr:hypothetical protein [Ignavibacteria bacterium]MCC7158592.1 hypothetical protein [Ignavibacteria bacterium]
MFLCQWSLDIVFGKQKQALDIIRNWGAEKMKSSAFSRSTANRVYVGFVGTSAAHIVDEYVFENLDDFEKALSDMGKPQFRQFAEAISSLIVPGTQKWNIFKIL